MPQKKQFGWLVLAGLAGGCAPHPQDTPLIHQAYVWQRLWDRRVQQAVRDQEAHLSGLVILVREIAWTGVSGSQVVRIPMSTAMGAGRPLGLALRVGPGRMDPEKVELVVEQARELVAEARSVGLQPSEVQVDFDAAESQLLHYANWIGAVKEAVAPVPVTITMLPTWLGRPGMETLARQVDGLVLQVHSFSRPESVDGPLTLMDPEASRGWVVGTSGLGVPFRVALPTYGYEVAFNGEGRFVSASAVPGRVRGGAFVQVRADPKEMSRWLGWLRKRRPPNLQGVLWFRLPIPEERLNWSAATLQAVIQGAPLRSKMAASAQGDQLIKIFVENQGNVAGSFPSQVQVNWSGPEPLASDGLGRFRSRRMQPGAIRFARSEARSLAPGERVPVGWIRWTTKKEVEVRAVSDSQ